MGCMNSDQNNFHRDAADFVLQSPKEGIIIPRTPKKSYGEGGVTPLLTREGLIQGLSLTYPGLIQG